MQSAHISAPVSIWNIICSCIRKKGLYTLWPVDVDPSFKDKSSMTSKSQKYLSYRKKTAQIVGKIWFSESFSIFFIKFSRITCDNVEKREVTQTAKQAIIQMSINNYTEFKTWHLNFVRLNIILYLVD